MKNLIIFVFITIMTQLSYSQTSCPKRDLLIKETPSFLFWTLKTIEADLDTTGSLKGLWYVFVENKDTKKVYAKSLVKKPTGSLSSKDFSPNKKGYRIFMQKVDQTEISQIEKDMTTCFLKKDCSLKITIKESCELTSRVIEGF